MNLLVILTNLIITQYLFVMHFCSFKFMSTHNVCINFFLQDFFSNIITTTV